MARLRRRILLLGLAICVALLQACGAATASPAAPSGAATPAAPTAPTSSKGSY